MNLFPPHSRIQSLQCVGLHNLKGLFNNILKYSIFFTFDPALWFRLLLKQFVSTKKLKIQELSHVNTRTVTFIFVLILLCHVFYYFPGCTEHPPIALVFSLKGLWVF